jgi:AraC-like DNA-binding protein
VADPVAEYVQHRPPEDLRAAVTACHGYRLVGFAPGVHLGLPSPYLTVVVPLDAPLRVRTTPDDGSRRLDALLGGLHAAPVRIDHDGSQLGIQLALTPTGCRGLLGMPPAEVVGAVVPLTSVLGRRVAELAERAAGATTWPARFAAVDDVLRRALSDARPVRPELAFAWRRLVGSRGGVGVAELAAETGWSRRHLSGQFRREFGLGPKTVGRIARFDAAAALLKADPAVGVGTVAATAGYADQAHMVRDWHDFAGAAPSAWLAADQLVVRRNRPSAEERERHGTADLRGQAPPRFPFVQDAG